MPRLSSPLVLAGIVLLLVDLGLRSVETRLSKNAHAIAAFDVKSELVNARSGADIVAVGNSLIGEALDEPVFSAEPGAQFSSLEKFAIDASNIFEWYCLIDNKLVAALDDLDTVVIGFAGDQLSDQALLNVSRAFGDVCPARYLTEYSQVTQSVETGTWIEMAVVKSSKLYEHRTAIKNAILRRIIPNFASEAQKQNDFLRETGTWSQDVGSDKSSYSLLKSLIRSIDETGARILVVAMPLVANYSIPPEMCSAAGEGEVVFLDLRSMRDLDDTMFKDRLHLNTRGAELFTTELARLLADPASSTYTFCS